MGVIFNNASESWSGSVSMAASRNFVKADSFGL